MPLDIDHLVPEALGGLTVRENLWLACGRCNDFKGDRSDAIDPRTGQRVALFNPRTQAWAEHFGWSVDGTHIQGRTPTGRATVEALRLNNDFIVIARQFWIEADRWPPREDLQPGRAGEAP
jgi:HNH endonuclease